MKKTAVSDDEPIAWLSTDEASALLGVSLRSLYQLIDDGQLHLFKFGRVVRLQKHQVIEYRYRQTTRPYRGFDIERLLGAHNIDTNTDSTSAAPEGPESVASPQRMVDSAAIAHNPTRLPSAPQLDEMLGFRKNAHMNDFREIGARLSNWGRWGNADERGTTNFITPECVIAASALVKRGAIFDLGIPFDSKGPQPGRGRINPVRLMSETGDDQHRPGAFHYADDYVFMPLQAASQWDGLAHVYYDDQLYNGFPSSDIGPHGAKHCSIDKQAKGIVGRGVLLDIARMKGVPWLEAGTVITPEDLDQAAARQKVEIKSGDILLFRTGWRTKFVQERDSISFMAGEPGLGLTCCQWVYDHEIAAVASDNWAIEVLPGENADEPMQVHMVLIRDMGVTLGEILDLDELAADCQADGVWEFMLTAPPIKFTAAVGSPINPLAIK